MPPPPSPPIALLRLALAFTPAPLLVPALRLALHRIARADPALAHDLAALPPARILIAPTDLPRRLLLRLGGPPRLVPAATGARADATIRGSLAALLALAAGACDSDALFFSRALEITGDTAPVVALHNTLERHGADLPALLVGPLASRFRAPRQSARRRPA
ncbi:MAG: ubiquinone anaerobic biosynthesis accessory factor UbiT [Acetobacteraceae bacterium]